MRPRQSLSFLAVLFSARFSLGAPLPGDCHCANGPLPQSTLDYVVRLAGSQRLTEQECALICNPSNLPGPEPSPPPSPQNEPLLSRPLKRSVPVDEKPVETLPSASNPPHSPTATTSVSSTETASTTSTPTSSTTTATSTPTSTTSVAAEALIPLTAVRPAAAAPTHIQQVIELMAEPPALFDPPERRPDPLFDVPQPSGADAALPTPPPLPTARPEVLAAFDGSGGVHPPVTPYPPSATDNDSPENSDSQWTGPWAWACQAAKAMGGLLVLVGGCYAGVCLGEGIVRRLWRGITGRGRGRSLGGELPGQGLLVEKRDRSPRPRGWSQAGREKGVAAWA